jgi:NAD(P)-dependent dehydrogenase (short-subunit alcohol dehydrogenase family)
MSQNQRHADHVESHRPRPNQPEEVAEGITRRASPDASYTSGAWPFVDGRLVLALASHELRRNTGFPPAQPEARR